MADDAILKFAEDLYVSGFLLPTLLDITAQLPHDREKIARMQKTYVSTTFARDIKRQFTVQQAKANQEKIFAMLNAYYAMADRIVKYMSDHYRSPHHTVSKHVAKIVRENPFVAAQPGRKIEHSIMSRINEQLNLHSEAPPMHGHRDTADSTKSTLTSHQIKDVYELIRLLDVYSGQYNADTARQLRHKSDDSAPQQVRRLVARLEAITHGNELPAPLRRMIASRLLRFNLVMTAHGKIDDLDRSGLLQMHQTNELGTTWKFRGSGDQSGQRNRYLAFCARYRCSSSWHHWRDLSIQDQGRVLGAAYRCWRASQAS